MSESSEFLNFTVADRGERKEIFLGARSLVTFFSEKKVTGVWGGTPLWDMTRVWVGNPIERRKNVTDGGAEK
jgi:hypothetical protein